MNRSAAARRALRPRPARHGGAHRGSAGKNARWLGTGAALLTGLAVSLAALAFIAYHEPLIGIGRPADCLSSLISDFMAGVVGCLLWRRPGGAGRHWLSTSIFVAIAGRGAAHLAGHLGWGHPLLFTLMTYCSDAVLAACMSAAVVILYRSPR